MPPDQSSYPLSRSYLSTTRLIAQHALWQHDLRFLLHPTITASLLLDDPSRSNLNAIASPAEPQPSTSPPIRLHPPELSPRIADLATGTAFWSLSIHDQYPHARITASDISLSQAPPCAWLPPGLDVREWDFYTPIPKEWERQFDVVHIRLALLAIKGNDTRTVLESAWEMLKPGGWMQWDELNPEGASTVVAEGAGVEDEDVTQFQRMQELTDFAGLIWVRRLEGAFENAGFQSVGKAMFEGKKSMMSFFQSMQFLVMEEEGERWEEEARERVRRNVERGVHISKKGVARMVPKVVIWGRKPLAEGEERMADNLY